MASVGYVFARFRLTDYVRYALRCLTYDDKILVARAWSHSEAGGAAWGVDPVRGGVCARSHEAQAHAPGGCGM